MGKPSRIEPSRIEPSRIEIVRRAYALWEQAGKPDGKDQEFYLQAERELTDASDDARSVLEEPADHPR